MEISWPYVRQIILNDRINGYKPDRMVLNKIASYIPDVKFIGFGKYWEYHWHLIIESKIFPPSIEPLDTRGAIPLSALIKGLAKKQAT